jgi:hypothetical protein
MNTSIQEGILTTLDRNDNEHSSNNVNDIAGIVSTYWEITDQLAIKSPTL